MARISRLVRDTRQRSELKKVEGNYTDYSIQDMASWNSTPGTMGIKLNSTIAPGTAAGQRVGQNIQLVRIKVKGILYTGAENVFVRWAILKVKRDTLTVEEQFLQKPENWLWRNSQTVVPKWNARFVSRKDLVQVGTDGTTDEDRRLWDFGRIVKTGVITMPEYKQYMPISFSLNFRPGKRPRITFPSGDNEGVPNYRLFIWCNDMTAQPQLRDMSFQNFYYDA